MSAVLLALAVGAPSGAALALGVQRLRKGRTRGARSLDSSAQDIGAASDTSANVEHAGLWQAQLAGEAFLSHQRAVRQEQLIEHRKQLSGDDPWLDELLERLEAGFSRTPSVSRGVGL